MIRRFVGGRLPVMGWRSFFSGRLPRNLETSSPPSMYLGPEEVRFFQKIEDDRRREFALPTLVRHRAAYRKPLKQIDETSAVDVKELRAHLVTIVDRLDQISGNIAEQHNTNIMNVVGRRRTYDNSTLPRYPTEWTKDSLVRYLELLTRNVYGDPLLNSDVGIVQAMVKDLLRINNPEVIHSLSVEAFKMGIVYFIRQKNIRAARELFADMMAAGLDPDVEIFNTLLFANRIVIRAKSNWINHPLTVTENLLTKMEKMGIMANFETWNAILSTLQGGLGKGLFLEAMQRRSIPLTGKTYATVIGDIVQLAGAKQAMVYLNSQNSHPVGPPTISAIISKLLEERQYGLAWDYLQYGVEKWKFVPTSETLNTFARHIAKETQRIDWIIGIYGALETRWGVKANELTFRYMLECASRTPFHLNKYDLLESIYAHMADINGKIPGEAMHYIRNAERKDDYYKSVGVGGDRRLNFTKRLTPPRVYLMSEAKKTLQWHFQGDEPSFDNLHYGPKDSPRSIMASKLGVPRYQHNLQKPQFTHKSNKDWEKKKQQLKEERIIITESQYAKKLGELGPNLTLQEELKKRGVTST